jgi:uncharacterized membrane protein
VYSGQSDRIFNPGAGPRARTIFEQIWHPRYEHDPGHAWLRDQKHAAIPRIEEAQSMTKSVALTTELHETEARLLNELRTLRRGSRTRQGSRELKLTVGQRIADTVAANMGSWRFIIIQSIILIIWIILNVTAYVYKWDPYPFILLNLALSFQAAYAAPFIMMSQNRQQEIDRKKAENDFQVNVKAELEIELLHQKIDQLRETEVMNLTVAVKDLTTMLRKS